MTIQAQTSATWPPHKFVRPHEAAPSRSSCRKCGKVLGHESHIGIEEEHAPKRQVVEQDIDRHVLASAFEMVHLHATRLLMAAEIVADNVYTVDRPPVDKMLGMIDGIRENCDRLRQSYESGDRSHA